MYPDYLAYHFILRIIIYVPIGVRYLRHRFCDENVTSDNFHLKSDTYETVKTKLGSQNLF